jgi:hypothetical protein
MGHQLVFYMTPTDIRAVEAKLRALEAMVVIHSDSISATPRVVESLEVAEGGRRWLHFYLARRQDLPVVKMRPIPGRTDWFVDDSASPVIEFHCCFFNGKTLRDGRVYWSDDFYASDGAQVLKSAEFRAWAAKVRSTVKRFLKPYDGKLIGPDTALWLERSGGYLLMPHEDTD